MNSSVISRKGLNKIVIIIVALLTTFSIPKQVTAGKLYETVKSGALSNDKQWNIDINSYNPLNWTDDSVNYTDTNKNGICPPLRIWSDYSCTNNGDGSEHFYVGKTWRTPAADDDDKYFNSYYYITSSSVIKDKDKNGNVTKIWNNGYNLTNDVDQCYWKKYTGYGATSGSWKWKANYGRRSTTLKFDYNTTLGNSPLSETSKSWGNSFSMTAPTMNEFKITFDSKDGSACDAIPYKFKFEGYDCNASGSKEAADDDQKLVYATNSGFTTGTINSTSAQTVKYRGITGTIYVPAVPATGVRSGATGSIKFIAKYSCDDINLPTPTKEGYTFKGWNTKSDGTGSTYLTSYPGESKSKNPETTHGTNFTLYAQWEEVGYDITYKKGETDVPGDDDGPYTAKYFTNHKTLPANKYTGRNYTIRLSLNKPSNASSNVEDNGVKSRYSGNLSFAKWGCSNGNDYAADTNVSKLSQSDKVTMTAKWNTYTLTPPKPTLTGWTFLGWGATKSPSIAVEPATSKYDQSFSAQWRANTYKITYSGNNTTNNIYNDIQTSNYSGSTNSTPCTYDSNVTIANNGFSRTGYTFKHWNRNSDNSGKSYKEGEVVDKPNFTATDEGTVTLYSIWEPNKFTIEYTKGITDDTKANVKTPSTGKHRYDQNIGNSLPSSTYKGRNYTINYYKNKPQAATKEVDFSKNNVPDKTVGNLTFKHWSYKNDSGTASTKNANTSVKNITAKNDANVLLTAQWNSHTENFKTPYLHGWTYKGFSTTPGDSNQSTAQSYVKIDPATTEFKENRYASWEANRYYIDYNGNDTTYNVYGDKVTTKFTGTTATTTAYYDKTVKLATNGFSKVGYKFKEWNTKSDGSGDSYENGATLSKPNFTDLPWYKSYGTVDTHITLYAIWEPLRYTITFNSNDTSLANYNNTDSYKQKVTGKNDFRDASTLVTKKIRFDQFFDIDKCSFTRKNNLTLSNGILIKKGYNFIGWGRTNNLKTPSTSNTTDKTLLKNGVNIRNVITPTADGDDVNLYALWYKDIALTFNMNGGRKSGSDADVVLKSTIYNDRYEYTFHIDNTKNTSTPNQDVQIGSIDSWGIIGAEGKNKVYTRKDSDGTQYRFLGWSTNPDASEPDENMNVYDTSHHNSRYTIHDDTTLYAVWEPVLMAKLTFGNVLSKKKTTEWNTVSTYSSETELASEFKAGEQGLYIMNLRGNNNKQVTVTFDSAVTNVYNNSFFSVHDSLNTNVEGDSSVLDYCNLNKKYEPVAGKLLNNTFYVPMYLGTQTYADVVGESSYKSGGYPISFVISQDSFYYQSVYHTKEVIKLNARIKLTDKSTTSGGGGGGGSPYPDPTPGDPGMSILDQLRTKMKIRIR